MLGLKAPPRAAPGTDSDACSSSTGSTASRRAAAAAGDTPADQQPTAAATLNGDARQHRENLRQEQSLTRSTAHLTFYSLASD